ncbi:CGNR zinc finger domain-containing protein [Streptomyces sp. NRRL F-5126]|uniref:CGNR zinc finger domain-containing protein n=1 Tax=Streptomyces sp. NRRL F-5126 TaxID=1463857 RepID=UPI0004CAB241|nr:ABATE domain-containing protein [Streptomyces sp. NRRL F-5126]
MDDGEVDVRVALLGEPLPVELMNTIHVDERGHDTFDLVGDVDSAARWVDAIGPRLPATTGRGPGEARGARDAGGGGAAAALDEQDARRLRALRDALRALAAEVTDAPPQFAVARVPSRREALDTVNRLSGRARIWPELDWPDGGEPTATVGTGSGACDYVLSSLARQAAELFAGPDRRQLRTCLAPGCDRYFVKDHPRREWCTKACGNRARVARHYRRHRGGAARPAHDAAG